MIDNLARIQPRTDVAEKVAEAFAAAAVIGVGIFTIVLSFAIV